MTTKKDEWGGVYTPPNEHGWRSLRTVDVNAIARRVGECARAWEPNVNLIGNVKAAEIIALVDAYEEEKGAWAIGYEAWCKRHNDLAAERDALSARVKQLEQEACEMDEVLAETCDKLDGAEYERDEAVKALDAHKVRADRAESELHRRKF
jgi:hypothetical protein